MINNILKMSGMYNDYGAQRLTDNECLLVRNELINLFGDLYEEKSGTDDFFGNTNLLIPNPIKEKKDNGDLDIFCLSVDKSEKLIELIRTLDNVKKYNKNSCIHSLLFESKEIGKLIQIDLHIFTDQEIFVNSYWPYYRIPYLMFLFGIISNKLSIKTGSNGIYYGLNLDDNDSKDNLKYFLIEKNIFDFVKNIFSIDIDSQKFELNSYKKIIEFINDTEFSKTKIFKIDELRGKYKRKKNDKLFFLLSNIKNGQKDTDKFRTIVRKRMSEKYPEIKKLKEVLLEESLELSKKKTERKNFLLDYFKIKDLKFLTQEQKLEIPKIIRQI